MEILKTTKIKLDKRKTTHRIGELELNKIHNLAISRYEGDEGFYLIYYDSNGNELTDTYHNTITDAEKQAEFEFEIEGWEFTDSCSN